MWSRLRRFLGWLSAFWNWSEKITKLLFIHQTFTGNNCIIVISSQSHCSQFQGNGFPRLFQSTTYLPKNQPRTCRTTNKCGFSFRHCIFIKGKEHTTELLSGKYHSNSTKKCKKMTLACETSTWECNPPCSISGLDTLDPWRGMTGGRRLLYF